MSNYNINTIYADRKVTSKSKMIPPEMMEQRLNNVDLILLWSRKGAKGSSWSHYK